MAMHSDFPSWYRSVTVTPLDGVLQKRWAAVEEFANMLTAGLVVDLLKLVILRDARFEAASSQFVEVIRKNDESFSVRDGAEEIRVLAGVVLRLRLTQPGEIATAIASGLVCGLFSRSSVSTDDNYRQAAETYLIAQGRALREVPKKIDSFPLIDKATYTALVPDNSFTPAGAPTAHDAVFDLIEDFQQRVSQYFLSSNGTVGVLCALVAAQREEINFLWWLQNSYSKQLQKPFNEVGTGVAPLLFPMELADLTEIVPASNAVFGLLLSALEAAGLRPTHDTTSISASVNAMSRSWREQVTVQYPSDFAGSLCPVLLAIKTSLVTDGDQDWLPVYRKACDVPSDQALRVCDLAFQLYRERMFLRANAEKMTS